MRCSAGHIHKVAVRQLKLANYRNYCSLVLHLLGQHVVLTGRNGAGKTNLLEALSFLSPGRGLRRAAYSDVSFSERKGAGFVVFARLECALYGEVNIGTALEVNDSSRKVHINGINEASDCLTDYCHISILTPSMDRLFTGPSLDRRRFLDRMVLSIDSLHGRRIADYDRVMRARNRLFLDRNNDRAWLDALEVQMAELATAIAAARIDVIQLLNDMFAQTSSCIPFPRALLKVDGFLEKALRETSAIEVEEQFLHRLRKNRAIDCAAGRTLEGPHRTDLQVFYADKNMDATFCSTGEQKALLTGLVLCHARLTSTISNMAPILLLDEIAAHFDSHRRAALFDILDDLGGQAFMTGTDHVLFDSLKGRAEFFEIENGILLS
ncbi:DNA replication and repair protein [Bartonella clarridgeiae 73]|uniref:DNA replication and repair protein RecF n=1 Tax=Bartonella clarridgeiae (strain CCUG 45776 / CIP 104772 / 73) TaxID=696125 RepID=E6YG26_BARC7|nr:DNA replication/repair protein RecF [Bartonella clarridgeiae]WCR55579.1 MAG: DNA recombination and repair protein RecF [Bartonella clarridgeiae]CBI75814.1 DNA replication and repair protein [Bartonella clarridgeiae 73]